MSAQHSQPFNPAHDRPVDDTFAPSLPGAVDWPDQTVPQPAAQRGPVRRTRRRSRRGWWWLLLILLASVGLVAGVLVYLEQSYAGRILPNVSVRGVPVGNLSRDDARAAIEATFAPFLAQPVVLTYSGRSWTPTLAELGVTLEIDEALDAALAVGRGNDLFTNLQQIGAVWQYGVELPLRLSIDQDAMQRYLLARVAEVERPAVDARLVLNGTTVQVEPSATGRQVLVTETLHEILAAIQDLNPDTVALRTRALEPALRDDAAFVAQDQIAAMLAGPITLLVDNRPFVWSLDELARMIRVERVADPAGDRLVVSIDREMIMERLIALGDSTEVKGTYPRLNWNDGRLEIFQEGKPGRRIDEAQALDAVLAALTKPADQRTVAVSFREIPPPINAANLDQLGITTLIGVGRSDFTGSAPYRVTNIQAGMRLLHGVLIAPGEEFSFNQTIGRIDGSNGFVEGYAIIQNRTQLEWGGGICQDSTTVFRAAFWAGLPITERWGHSFYINWYDRYGFGPYGDGPGMDATIFTGGPDLKFLNDTGGWILMQTLVDTRRNLAEVRLYGPETGRKVLLEGPVITNRTPAPTEPVYVAVPDRPVGQPRQSDKARGGMDILFTRIVLGPDGKEIERREFVTRFKPWPDIFEYNPADLGPDGKPLPTPTPPPEPAPAEPAQDATG
ncbi:vanomycin resistance protein VanB [Chloroflexus islandicus]|uniref:Vanomycin resistance protein VanB n=1 Tax=Chloroflexus islandicus TaxID=1707952 RepID=A0A178MAB6_9CHLR|nr:peptidoglycan binding domain-containing protein [Chloroflexus islandicus]OAN44978.1 vanomycin resistance protein VanB [Chloroflexus islandicus]